MSAPERTQEKRMMKGPGTRYEGFKGKTSAEPTFPKALPPHTLRQELWTVEAKVHVCPAASFKDKEKSAKARGVLRLMCINQPFKAQLVSKVPAFVSKLSQVHYASYISAARLTVGKKTVANCY